MFGSVIVSVPRSFLTSSMMNEGVQVISFDQHFTPYFKGVVCPLRVFSLVVPSDLLFFPFADGLPIRDILEIKEHVTTKNQLSWRSIKRAVS